MIHGMSNGLGLIGRLHLGVDWTVGCIAVPGIREAFGVRAACCRFGRGWAIDSGSKLHALQTLARGSVARSAMADSHS
jgi:hypothetical protein